MVKDFKLRIDYKWTGGSTVLYCTVLYCTVSDKDLVSASQVIKAAGHNVLVVQQISQIIRKTTHYVVKLMTGWRLESNPDIRGKLSG